MRRQQLHYYLEVEYSAKGLFLALLLFTALQQPAPSDLEGQAWCLLGGLGSALALSAGLRLKQGHRIKGRLVPFLLFLMLESPELTYLGILGGMAVGAYLMPRHFQVEWLLPAMLVGGIVLGVGFHYVGRITHRWTRLGVSLALTVAPIAAILAWQFLQPGFLASASAAGFQLTMTLSRFFP